MDRGYFSFWYDLVSSAPPSNIIEYIIRRYIYPACQESVPENTKIVGAEWWVHSRKLGRNLGHQLHFDTEEHSLEDKHEILHPVCSSVCYLTLPDVRNGGSGGPTVIFDQRSHDVNPAKKAVVVHPVPDAVLYFQGDRLHGVLPSESLPPLTSKDAATATKSEKDSGEDSEGTEEEDSRRLTFMVGFWTVDVTTIGKERVPYGPCGPLPARDETGCTWHREMLLTEQEEQEWALWAKDQENENKNNRKTEETLLGVSVVEPAWVSVPTATTSVSLSPPELDLPEDIDQRFFVCHMEDFKAHLLERALSAPSVDDEDDEDDEDENDNDDDELNERPWH